MTGVSNEAYLEIVYVGESDTVFIVTLLLLVLQIVIVNLTPSDKKVFKTLNYTKRIIAFQHNSIPSSLCLTNLEAILEYIRKSIVIMHKALNKYISLMNSFASCCLI